MTVALANKSFLIVRLIHQYNLLDCKRIGTMEKYTGSAQHAMKAISGKAETQVLEAVNSAM